MREPVLVDSSIHRAFTALYGVYVATGVIAAFTLPPSLATVGGAPIARFWILGLAVTSLTSLVFSLHETRERKEMISTTMLLAFLAIYSAAILINGFASWSLDKIMFGTFTLSFLVMPMWRVRFFFRKYRKPRG